MKSILGFTHAASLVTLEFGKPGHLQGTAMAGQVHIGTSGWNYKHWKGRFYPKDLPQDRWFEHYASEFSTVEINNTFYHQPKDATFDQWRGQAPAGFSYALKANRYLTHLRKLKEPAGPLERFLAGAQRLGQQLGPVLYQLPGNWRPNPRRLQDFLEQLPADLDHAMEFRNREWLNDETYDLLAEQGVALCVHDMLPRHPRRVTGRIAYIRFHGTGQSAGGPYPPRRLRRWADWIAEIAEERDVYVYFNNDEKGHAPADAGKLKAALADRGVENV